VEDEREENDRIKKSTERKENSQPAYIPLHLGLRSNDVRLSEPN
jgi:hypothetical protein